MDSNNWKLCLNRQEVQDLGNGLLVSAVGEHDAVETSARQELTHLGTKTPSGSNEGRVCACMCACVCVSPV